MNDPIESDLEKLLERMRQERESGPAFPALPFTVPPNGATVHQTHADACLSPSPQNGCSPSVPAANERAATPPEPEPSKLIFGRDLRNPEFSKDVFVPEKYRVDPKKVHIDSLLIERVGDVQERPVKWLWPGRIPLGRVTLLAGDPGICKSLVALDIAARVTSGAAWPDEPSLSDSRASSVPTANERAGTPREPAGAIVFSMEDDLCDTIKPRLMRAGADDQRTYVIEGVFNKPPLVDLRYKRRFRIQEDILSLRQVLKELWPVRLVVFDPITAYCGNGDGVAMSVVHSMLAPLIELAAEYQVAILCTTHLRGSSRKAVYSAVGNLSFTTAARAVWGLVPDPRDKARRLMVPVKMNLAPNAAGLAFRIDVEGKLVWETEPVPLSADEALDEKKLGTKLEAASWLFEEVKEGEQRSRDLFRRGTSEMGFSKSTIDRARTLLKLNVRHVGRRGERHTMWSLSDQTPRDL